MNWEDPEKDKMTRMACKVVDDLVCWYSQDSEMYIVYYKKYGMAREAPQLWRALWILERDIRKEHGSKWANRSERREFNGSR